MVDIVIQQIEKLKVETVNLGGNEPIFTNGLNVHESMLPYILKELNKRNIKVGITTAGISLIALKNTYPECLKLLNDVDISFDSPYEKEHNENRGGDVYKYAIQALEICKENYEFLREYDWIITKGIFSEMFAADGTLYTEKLKKEQKIVKSDIYDNNKYDITNPKVKLMYQALKRWHKSHMKLYDMIIDPISSPKAINAEGERKFYDLYYQLKIKDLDFMKKVLEEVERGISEQQLNEHITLQIAKNAEFYETIYRQGNQLCREYELNYDGQENPFIK